MQPAFYSISEVSALFGLPISTLRYYDAQGLIPNLARHHGIRRFSQNNIEAIRVIECLKASGLEIRDIAAFMELSQQGNDSLQARLQLFLQRREELARTLDHLHKQMDMINFKCWYYQTACALQDEAAVQQMIPNGLPEEVQPLYRSCHAPLDQTLPSLQTKAESDLEELNPESAD